MQHQPMTCTMHRALHMVHVSETEHESVCSGLSGVRCEFPSKQAGYTPPQHTQHHIATSDNFFWTGKHIYRLHRTYTLPWLPHKCFSAVLRKFPISRSKALNGRTFSIKSENKIQGGNSYPWPLGDFPVDTKVPKGASAARVPTET